MLTRPSELSLTQTTSTSGGSPHKIALEPPIVGAEDTTLTMGERGEERAGLLSYERPDNDRRAIEKSGKGTEEPKAGQDVASERAQKDDATSDFGQGNGGREEEEEEEEMTQERLQSLLEDIKLEGGLEDMEITEESVNAILEQVRQAERVMCSVSGWRSETSDIIVDSSAPPGAGDGRWDLVITRPFFPCTDLYFCDSSSVLYFTPPAPRVKLICRSIPRLRTADRMEVRLTWPGKGRKRRPGGMDLRRTAAAAQRDQAEDGRREATGPSTKSR